MTQSVFDTGFYKAVEKAGSVAKLAARLGVKRQACYDWLKRGWAPPARAIQIEELYGVPRASLMDPRLLTQLSGAKNRAARDGHVQYRPRGPKPASSADDLV